MAMVQTTKLYRVKTVQVVRPDVGPLKTIEAGMILWMHGSRKSSISGRIGTFSETYEQANGLSPKAASFEMKTEHTEPVY